MREDMFKVIVERPRHGAGFRTRRNRLAGPDDLPSKIGVKRYVRVTGTWSKGLSENLAPLRRFLAKQVGRPWDKVYAEVCANLKADNTVQQHVRDHLRDFVAFRLGVGRDGEWLERGRRWGAGMTWHQPFYVDPEDGILKDSAKYWRKRGIDPKPWKRRRNERDGRPDVIWLSKLQALRRFEGIWFAVAYRLCAEDPADTHVYDVVRKRFVPAGQRHAVSKRQLSARELAQHGLQNANQVDDGPVPQRHKRRRKRS